MQTNVTTFKQRELVTNYRIYNFVHGVVINVASAYQLVPKMEPIVKDNLW